MFEIIDNGGYCNYCQHMLEKLEDEEENNGNSYQGYSRYCLISYYKSDKLIWGIVVNNHLYMKCWGYIVLKVYS